MASTSAGPRTDELQPNPGSDAARAAGCECPVMDNGHGRGRGGNGALYGWWITATCKLHGPHK